MPEDSTASLKEITKELKEHKSTIQSILEALGKTGKAIKANNEDTSKYTGMLKAIHTAHEGLFGTVSREARIVYNIFHKYTTDSTKASDTLRDAQKKRATELAEQYNRIADTAAENGTRDNASVVRRLSIIREELLPLEEAIASGAGAAVGVTAGLAGAGAAGKGLLATVERLAPEIAVAGLVLDEVGKGFNYLLTMGSKFRDFNKELVGANVSVDNRNRLFLSALETSARLGISQKETTAVLAAMVRNGQQFNADLTQDVTIASMLHEGLGLSVDSGVELLTTAQLTHQSYAGLADTLADVQNRLGLSAEMAAKMAISINKSLLYFGPKSSSYTSETLEKISPYAQALVSSGKGDLADQIPSLMDSVGKNPFTLLSMQGRGANGQFDLSVMLDKMMQASRIIQAQTTEFGKTLAARGMESQLGLPPEYDTLLRSLAGSKDNFDYQMAHNPQFRQQQKLIAAFNAQMAQASSATDRLKSAFDALITSSMIPLMAVLTHFSNLVTPILQDLAGNVQKGGLMSAVNDLVVGAKIFRVEVDQFAVWVDGWVRNDNAVDKQNLKEATDSLARSMDANTEATITATDLAKKQAEKPMGVAFATASRRVGWVEDEHHRAQLVSVGAMVDQMARHNKAFMDHLEKLNDKTIYHASKNTDAVIGNSKNSVLTQKLLNMSEAASELGTTP